MPSKRARDSLARPLNPIDWSSEHACSPERVIEASLAMPSKRARDLLARPLNPTDWSYEDACSLERVIEASLCDAVQEGRAIHSRGR